MSTEPTELRAPRFKVLVTQSHIDTAIRNNDHSCMIAEALKSKLPKAKQVSADMRTIRWTDPEKGLRYVYLMPPIGTNALIRFDNGESLRPFYLNLFSAHIRSMVPRKTGPVHNLGRPRHVLTESELKEGKSGDIVGGAKAQRRSSLHKNRRVYGARAYTSLFDKPDPNLPEAEFKAALKGYVSQAGAHSKRKKST